VYTRRFKPAALFGCFPDNAIPAFQAESKFAAADLNLTQAGFKREDLMHAEFRRLLQHPFKFG